MEDNLLHRQLTYRSRCKNFYSFIEAWILTVASVVLLLSTVAFVVLYALKEGNNEPATPMTVEDTYKAHTFNAFDQYRTLGF